MAHRTYVEHTGSVGMLVPSPPEVRRALNMGEGPLPQKPLRKPEPPPPPRKPLTPTSPRGTINRRHTSSQENWKPEAPSVLR